MTVSNLIFQMRLKCHFNRASCKCFMFKMSGLSNVFTFNNNLTPQASEASVAGLGYIRTIATKIPSVCMSVSSCVPLF